MPAQPKVSHQLQNKRALIIGGSSGIGFAVASALIEEGAHVTIASSNQSKVDTAVQRLSDAEKQFNADPKRIQGFTVNLKGPETEPSLEALFDKTGRIDHLIYTAGDALAITPLDKVTHESLVNAGQVRFFGSVLAAKVGRKYLNKGGSITLTTGSISVSPKPDWTIVSGYAGGLSALGRQLAFDLSKDHLRVNVVSPGAVETELWDGLPEQARQSIFEKTAKEVLTHRIGQPEQVAQTYLGLLKDGNITAQTVYTDAGEPYGPPPQ